MPLSNVEKGNRMNTCTQGVWEVINEAIVDDETLLADLKKILLKEYAPFLTSEQSVQVNTNTLQSYFLDKLNQWYDWLPNTTINLLGGELAREAFKGVDWSSIADELRKQLVPACDRER